MRAHRHLAIVAAGLLAGCADFGAPIDGGSAGGQAPLSPQESRLQAVEARVGEVNRKIDNLNAASQSQNLSRLESEMRSLRGEVERLRYDIETGNQRSRELYQDLDRRMQAIENERRSARLAIEPKIAQPPAVPANQEEDAAYSAVLDQLKSGKTDEAIAGFRDFVGRYPQGRLADNAWYWMGEAHFVKRDYESAARSFQTVLDKFPASQKAPDALLKIGMVQLEQKQKDAARTTWQRVIDQYPSSNAANLARQRLDQNK